MRQLKIFFHWVSTNKLDSVFKDHFIISPNTSTISGVDPAFYPEDHLNVQSMNLELRQSLLRNGFGRSTRALVESKNAQNL
jgi:hypothetical protein